MEHNDLTKSISRNSCVQSFSSHTCPVFIKKVWKKCVKKYFYLRNNSEIYWCKQMNKK